MLIRGEGHFRGRHLFQCEYPNVRHLLEDDAHLRPRSYLKEYGSCLGSDSEKTDLDQPKNNF